MFANEIETMPIFTLNVFGIFSLYVSGLADYMHRYFQSTELEVGRSHKFICHDANIRVLIFSSSYFSTLFLNSFILCPGLLVRSIHPTETIPCILQHYKLFNTFYCVSSIKYFIWMCLRSTHVQFNTYVPTFSFKIVSKS